MQVSLELYFTVNLLMNAMMISVCARSVGRLRWRRVILASAVGAVYACAMYLPALALMKGWHMRLILLFTLSAISLRVDRPWDVLTGSVRLAACTFLAGGMMMLARQLAGGQWWLSTLIALPLIALAMMLLLSDRNRQLERWEVQLVISSEYGTVSASALIDTGNRLREPLSGLPVLIMEEKLIRRLLPPGFRSEWALKNLPSGFRLVRFGALGGGGQMVCFRPKDVHMSYGEGWARAPEIWIAVYPGKMPGATRALAPPVIGRVQPPVRSQRFG